MCTCTPWLKTYRLLFNNPPLRPVQTVQTINLCLDLFKVMINPQLSSYIQQGLGLGSREVKFKHPFSSDFCQTGYVFASRADASWQMLKRMNFERLSTLDSFFRRERYVHLLYSRHIKIAFFYAGINSNFGKWWQF